MSTRPTREELIQAVRDGWPEHGSTFYPARGRTETVPPVRDGGMTARFVDYAVDTVLSMIDSAEPPTKDVQETIA